MDTKLINDILNDCVSKSKLKIFYEHIKNYNLNPNDYIYKEKEKKISHKIPLVNLKERLFDDIKKPEEEIKLQDFNKSIEKKELFKKCDKVLQKIKYESKSNKIYYYYFGKYLKQIKDYFVVRENRKSEDVINYFTKRYTMKKSAIYRYIKFSKECDRFNILITCNLTYEEIMQNIVEIRELLIDKILEDSS